MEIYDNLVDGLNSKKEVGQSIEEYLRSLQPSVRHLRRAYCYVPVDVPYHLKNVQAAYLVAYLPHYYQQIYSILLNDGADSLNKTLVNLGFIGGGPGSEVYGSIKYILANCPEVETVNVNILDTNASTWNFSHDIVLKNLIKKIPGIERINLNWSSTSFDLIDEEALYRLKEIFQNLDFLTIQNCINEISPKDIPSLRKNIVQIFNLLPNNSCFVMADLTSTVRTLIKTLEQDIEASGKVKFKKSTLSNPYPSQVISVHHRPSQLIAANLLTGADGLIPRKNLKYDYSLLSKFKSPTRHSLEEAGFMTLYSPLSNNLRDANDFVHTKTFIGIDFGTSTTVISYAALRNEKIEVKAIPIPQNDKEGHATYAPLVPSVIALWEKRMPMVGRSAAERKSLMTLGKDIWYGFKEHLATLDQIEYPHSDLKDSTSSPIKNAKDALVLFLSYLKKETIKYVETNKLPPQIEYSVTIPAGYDFRRKYMLRHCLEKAGIHYSEAPFIEEPTAALINYLFESKIPHNLTDEPQVALVLDFGAGTFDISIIELTKQLEGVSSKLLSVQRNGFEGSSLIDEMIALQQLPQGTKIEDLNGKERAELDKLCEDLKIKICNSVETDTTVNFDLNPRAYSNETTYLTSTKDLSQLGFRDINISFLDFSKLMDNYWTKIEKTINAALIRAGLTIKKPKTIILNGGGSRNPYIQNKVRQFFSSAHLVRPDNIQEHVSRGAALNSFVMNAYGKQIVSNILAFNICLCQELKNVVIIEGNQLLPSNDAELIPAEKTSSENRLIRLMKDIETPEYAEFLIPATFQVDKLIIFVNFDNEIECEIVTQDKVVVASRITEKTNLSLIKISNQ